MELSADGPGEKTGHMQHKQINICQMDVSAVENSTQARQINKHTMCQMAVSATKKTRAEIVDKERRRDCGQNWEREGMASPRVSNEPCPLLSYAVFFPLILEQIAKSLGSVAGPQDSDKHEICWSPNSCIQDPLIFPEASSG